MKNVKRALAMCLTLVLLLSCSPVFNVSATGTESESDTPSAYDQLMDNYKLVVSTDFSDPDNTLLTKNQETDKIFIDEDEHLKFLNTTAGKYVNVNHYLGTPSGKIIFEADVCWNTEGLRIGFLSLSDKKALMEFDNGTFRFANTSDTMPMTAGQWYTISCAINLDDDVYDAFVDEVQVVSGATISADVQLKGIRLYVHKNSSENADGDFLVDNVKWYVYRECTDADNDGYCDYTGCGKRTQYAVNESGEIVNANGDVLTEITASGVLDLNGQDAAVKVTGATTKLSVVDTSWMTNGLSGEKAAKLTVDPESTGTVESYTQYGDFKYLKVPSEDGTYFTFHPFNLAITQIGLNTADGHESVCIEVQFIANKVIRDKFLAEENYYGIKNAETGETASAEKVYGFGEKYRVKAYYDLEDSLTDETKFTSTYRLQAYMVIDGVDIVSNYTAEFAPSDVWESVNAGIAAGKITPTQTQADKIALLKSENTHLADAE